MLLLKKLSFKRSKKSSLLDPLQIKNTCMYSVPRKSLQILSLKIFKELPGPCKGCQLKCKQIPAKTSAKLYKTFFSFLSAFESQNCMALLTKDFPTLATNLNQTNISSHIYLCKTAGYQNWDGEERYMCTHLF